MRLLWVSNILNLIFDPCLIFGLGPFPKLGVTGAALATFSGRGIGVLYQFYRLGKGTERIRILAPPRAPSGHGSVAPDARIHHRNSAVPDRPGELDRPGPHCQPFRCARPGRLHHRYSHRHLRDLAFLGIEQCRRNPGRPEPWRGPSRPRPQCRLANRPMEHALPRLGRDCLYRRSHPGSSGCSRRIPRWFRSAINCLRIFSCGNVAYAYGMVLLQAFNGAGDTLTPTYVNLFGFWILEIPLAWWLAMHTFMRCQRRFRLSRRCPVCHCADQPRTLPSGPLGKAAYIVWPPLCRRKRL